MAVQDMLYLLPQAIDRAAERDATHEAVRFNGMHLSYGELAAASNRLARVLIDLGVRRGDRVGLYLNKSLYAAVAVYGIMKAGAAYVPLDPTAPVARLAYIIRDAGIRHLVTEDSKANTLEILAGLDGTTLESLIGPKTTSMRSVSWDEVEAAPSGLPETATIELDLSYILYTSGSTGVPKGVMHTHRSALSFAEVAARTYGFRSDDRISNHAPLHFDLSTLDFFSAAVAGATTVVIPEIYTKVPASLSKLIADERLSVLYTVPFALIQMLIHGALEQRNLDAVRWVLFGGEPFPPKHLRRLMALLSEARFCNVYGPTETNGCTYYVVPPFVDTDNHPIPIGKPYENVEALIVDAEDRPVPADEAGELLIRSPTMMRGYWGRPDLNARVFYRRPAGDPLADTFHRTGDLVRRGADGNLNFLGRLDRQVKVRGYRVELDEIEVTLLSHPLVEAAAVFDLSDGDDGRRIEAAVIPTVVGALRPSDLLHHLSAHLPTYAIPEQISIANQFPRTTTGKIDRLQLAVLATNRIEME